MGSRSYNLINNYIYFYHTDTFFIIPVYPETIADSNSVTFASTPLLSRSAPIYSYSNSGPHTIQISFNLHRDMMSQVNYGISNANVEMDDDYIDTLIKGLQAATLPSYKEASKMVDPPIVALRIGNEIYCKGVLTGGITTTYSAPILANGKYSQISVGFTISEIDPYDAEYVMEQGSFRGFNATLENKLWGNLPGGTSNGHITK